LDDPVKPLIPSPLTECQSVDVAADHPVPIGEGGRQRPIPAPKVQDPFPLADQFSEAQFAFATSEGEAVPASLSVVVAIDRLDGPHRDLTVEVLATRRF
jgi:hypothetical protein